MALKNEEIYETNLEAMKSVDLLRCVYILHVHLLEIEERSGRVLNAFGAAVSCFASSGLLR